MEDNFWNNISNVSSKIKWDKFKTFLEYGYEKDEILKKKHPTFENFLQSFESRDLTTKERLESRNFDNWYFEMEYFKNGYKMVGAFYLLPFLFYALKEKSNPRRVDICEEISIITHWSPLKSEYCKFTFTPDPFPHFLPNDLGLSMPLDIACKMVVFNNIDFIKAEIENDDSEIQEACIDLLVSCEYPIQLLFEIFGDAIQKVKQSTREYIRRELGSVCNDYNFKIPEWL